MNLYIEAGIKFGPLYNPIRVNEVSECLESESRSDRGSWLLSGVPVLLGESVKISLRSGRLFKAISGLYSECNSAIL